MQDLIQAPTFSKAEQPTSFFLQNFERVIDQLDCNAKTRTKYKSDAKLFISFVSEDGLHLNTFRSSLVFVSSFKSLSFWSVSLLVSFAAS